MPVPFFNTPLSESAGRPYNPYSFTRPSTHSFKARNRPMPTVWETPSMLRTIRAIAALSLACAAWTSALAPASARAERPDLFYNYYAGPSAMGGVPAQLYVSPRSTPPMVGHTWITYQPLMPHEFLYKHKRTYYKYDREGGFTTTHVRWH